LLPGAAPGTIIDPANANTFAWITFVDILIFFAVLMMGFAYLWKRGDLDWVRSTAAEETKIMPPIAERPAPQAAPTPEPEPALAH
jgi:hypothetical protein